MSDPTEYELQEKINVNNELKDNYSMISAIDMEEEQSDSSVIYILFKVMAVCTIFMLIELFGGIMANSVAVISDALHLTIDIIGYLI